MNDGGVLTFILLSSESNKKNGFSIIRMQYLSIRKTIFGINGLLSQFFQNFITPSLCASGLLLV